MPSNIIKVSATTLFISLVTVNQALALCLLGLGDCGGGGETAAVPEFDGPGAVAVVALLASVVAILYKRSRG